MSSSDAQQQDPAAAAAAAAAALDIARQSYAAAIVGCVTFGMYAVLAGICLHFLLQRKTRTTGHYITLGYTVLMLLVSIIYFTCSCKWSEIEFVEATIDPSLFAILTGASTLTVTKNAASVVNIFLADSLILYRTFVIWQKNLPVIIFPTLVYLGSVASGIGLMYYSGQPAAAFGQSMVTNFGTAFWSISVGFNVLSTLLITGKLYYHQRQMTRLKQSSEYLSLAAICVESAAIYSIAGLIYIPLFAQNSTKQFAFSALLQSATVIAPTLIILRIALGTAVKADHHTKGSMGFRTNGRTTVSGFTNSTQSRTAQGTWTASKSEATLPTHVVEFHPMDSVNAKESRY